MIHAGPFIFLMFLIAIIFFYYGYYFSKLDRKNEMLENTSKWNCELECIITELEETINSGQWSEAVKFGMKKAVIIIEDHRRKYIYEK